jgi:hypothetical protein
MCQISACSNDCATGYMTDQSPFDSRQLPEMYLLYNTPGTGLPSTQTPFQMALVGDEGAEASHLAPFQWPVSE